MLNLHMSPSAKIRLLATTALGLVVTLAAPPTARANPTGGTVVGGSATITAAPGTTTINQTSNRAVINWEGFSIDSGETTTFVQPNANAVALNRVTGSEASMINGTLTANGNVFLINQNGVMIGAGAKVNVGGLVATTTDIDDKKFLDGIYHFDRPTGNPDAKVINNGLITAADQGLAVLVGPTVENNHVINAKLGTVALGSAETFTVDLAGDGLISFDTGQPVNRTPGNPQVSNSGTIDAAGGTVILSAGQAASVVDKAIDMSGVITAQSVGLEGGTIVLSGGEGTTVVSGTLDASGAAAGTKGGTIEVTGATVALTSSAKVDASGSAGGGKVRIGGDKKGGGTTPHAQVASVAQGATINVSARDKGDGGSIIVWSDRSTVFDGLATARGGSAGATAALSKPRPLAR
ncbi:filamentous hemagglutinin N-terminal domain-containing protein [Oleomonas cavernae]|uniref:Filamentous hemagglutinin N-terminal domain-containing protein n=1 Tax=Oleomonas cavernae TaxID=2320859 RepID=A0A418WE77_9PROT|nr:filamentous hemagglutinin N-terminal domain-containing protein [Oleomonas cavernae]RJF88325.1 filamentous hemagglutinin N-terminal domain-containing protein [Oleomonas cavernae]